MAMLLPLRQCASGGWQSTDVLNRVRRFRSDVVAISLVPVHSCYRISWWHCFCCVYVSFFVCFTLHWFPYCFMLACSGVEEAHKAIIDAAKRVMVRSLAQIVPSSMVVYGFAFAFLNSSSSCVHCAFTAQSAEGSLPLATNLAFGKLGSYSFSLGCSSSCFRLATLDCT